MESLRVFRVSAFERTLVLYLPRPDGVEILRVVHGSRNLEAIFRTEGSEQRPLTCLLRPAQTVTQ